MALSRGCCSAALRLPTLGYTFVSPLELSALSRGCCSAALRLPTLGYTFDFPLELSALSRGCSRVCPDARFSLRDPRVSA